MALETIPENTTAYLTVTFKDKNGNPVAPNSASWLAIDLYSGNVVKTETALSPGSTVEITIPPDVNAIVNENLPKEIRRIIVKALFGATDASNEKYDYNVANLDQI